MNLLTRGVMIFRWFLETMTQIFILKKKRLSMLEPVMLLGYIRYIWALFRYLLDCLLELWMGIWIPFHVWQKTVSLERSIFGFYGWSLKTIISLQRLVLNLIYGITTGMAHKLYTLAIVSPNNA